MRPSILRSLAAVALLGLAAPHASEAEAHRVGIGRADLTWHFGDRLRSIDPQLPADPERFAGLHTRAFAKAVVVDGPEGALAIVRTDTLLITGDLHEAVAQRVEEQVGIPPERLTVAATHTHVANNGLFPHPAHGAFFRSFDPREYSFLADRIAEAVRLAVLDLRPAKLAVGSGFVTLPAVNRRYTDRELQNDAPFGNDPSRLDPELGVLRFDDAATGKPMAIVMSYGLHPVVLIDNPLFSADFVAFAEREVETAFASQGGGPVAIWWQGAEGDQDPIFVRRSYPEAEWTGRIFGREAVKVARGLDPEPIVRTDVREKIVPVPPEGVLVPSWQPAGESAPRLPIVGPAALLIPSSLRLQAIEIATSSAATVLFTWPGEPIRDLGVGLKTAARNLGFDKAFVLGLANDWGGYFVTPEEYDRGRYEASDFNFYGRESGAYLSRHLVDLARSLATGAEPSEVPLPPSAAADRRMIEAIATAGRLASTNVEQAFFPPPDGALEGLAEPDSGPRLRVVSFEWRGGSPETPRGWAPKIAVQRKTASGFVDVVRDGTGDVLVEVSALPTGESVWRARWEALPDALAGTYRFLVDGRRQNEALSDESFTLASEEFEVTPCECIEAGALETEAVDANTVALRVEAFYPEVEGGFRLRPERVATGEAVVEVLDSGGTAVETLSLPFVSQVSSVARTVVVADISGENLPVTIEEPTEIGAFGGRHASGFSFHLVEIRDAFGNAN